MPPARVAARRSAGKAGRCWEFKAGRGGKGVGGDGGGGEVVSVSMVLVLFTMVSVLAAGSLSSAACIATIPHPTYNLSSYVVESCGSVQK